MCAYRSFAGLGFLGLVSFGFGQNATMLTEPMSPAAVIAAEAYLKPPPEIERFVMAPRWENVNLGALSPDRSKFLVSVSDGMPPLAALGKPHKNFAGIIVDTSANRSRTLTTNSSPGLKLVDARTGKSLNIEVPKGAEVSSSVWSPDGTMIAYFANFEDRSMLCVADAKTGKSRIVSKIPLLATEVTTVEWTGDSKQLAAVLIPTKRMVFPDTPAVAPQPKVKVSDNTKHRFRTYPTLLETQTDSSQLEYFVTGQLALIDVKSGKAQNVGEPAMIQSVDVSPDGKYFRVTTLSKPFSYLVPYSSFGAKEEIWDSQGKALAEITKRELSLAPVTATPAGGTPPTPTGKRNLAWRPDGQGLSFIETEPAPQRSDRPATDGETPLSVDDDEQGGRRGPGAGTAQQDNRKDRVMQWVAPFGKDDAKVVWTAEGRITSVRYSEDCKTLFVSDSKDGNSRTYAIFLDEPTKPYMISSVKSAEFHDTPGTLVGRQGSNGQPVVAISSDGAVYLAGTKYDRDPKAVAPKPFLDRVVIKTGDKKRLFESSATQYETFTALLDDDAKLAVISRQSPTQVANSYVLDLGTKAATPLTQNRDLTPELTACQRFVVDVTRVDGFKFKCKVTLPANWKKGDKLPAMFWFYPSEFADQAAYDRTLRTFNKNAFPNVSAQSMAILTQIGYAFVEPDLPITGAEGQMNDNYVVDLRNSLYAVINKLEDEGMIDRNRLGIGGHSYGAFSTANAMVHTPYFKAGIAGSGAYNRTLTPFGFQSEQRQFWEKRELYESMSPFYYANQMSGALLMTHGMQDQNIGTFPINSERLFQALAQLGKPCALYMYPYEDHGQMALETVLDKWARWVAWLDIYVKNAK